MKKNRLIPFTWMPGSWGLSGKTRQIAEAEYYFEGDSLERELVIIDLGEGYSDEELDRALLDRKFKDHTSLDYQLELHSHMCKHNLYNNKYEESLSGLLLTLEGPELARKEHELKIHHEIYESEEEQELAGLELEKDSLTDSEYQKRQADILGDPYVNVLSMDVDPNSPNTGMMELDFNDRFVSMLMENGYRGGSDEEIVNQWFNELCRTILLQEKVDQDYGLERKEDE